MNHFLFPSNYVSSLIESLLLGFWIQTCPIYGRNHVHPPSEYIYVVNIKFNSDKRDFKILI